MPSSMVASAEIDTMSVRGVIASRTTMSPNSKIEWISLRSSRSMASSSAATSAIWRISSSLTNGPSLRPRPGSTTLARPIRPRESTRNGGKFVKNARIGATRSSQSAPVMSCRYLDPRSPSLFLLELPEARQQLALPLSHRLGLLILGMVVVQQMQDTVDDEERDLVIQRSLPAGLAPGHLRAHHDVADHGRRVGGLRRRAGPGPALVGLPPTRGDVVVHREREHVRRPAAAEKPLVEVRHRLLVHEDHRHLGLLGNPLLVEHHAGEPDPAEDVHLHLRLLVGPEHRPHPRRSS